jgi:hypothetical protein
MSPSSRSTASAEMVRKLTPVVAQFNPAILDHEARPEPIPKRITQQRGAILPLRHNST